MTQNVTPDPSKNMSLQNTKGPIAWMAGNSVTANL